MDISIIDHLMNYQPPGYVGVIIFILIILFVSTLILFFKQIAKYHYTKKRLGKFFIRAEITEKEVDEFRRIGNKMRFAIFRYLSDLFIFIFKYQISSSGSIKNTVHLQIKIVQRKVKTVLSRMKYIVFYVGVISIILGVYGSIFEVLKSLVSLLHIATPHKDLLYHSFIFSMIPFFLATFICIISSFLYLSVNRFLSYLLDELDILFIVLLTKIPSRQKLDENLSQLNEL